MLLGSLTGVWAGMGWALIEIAVAIMLVCYPLNRRVYLMVIGLGVVFCVVLVRLLTMPDPPGCGCLTVAALRAGPLDHWLGLIRAFGLIWLAWIGLRLCPRAKPGPVAGRPANAGFTLVETLVVIALIALLVGLLLPALEGAFVSSKQTRQAIRQRETYSAVMAYTEDYGQTFPYFGTPHDPYGPITIAGTVFENQNYFGIPKWFWASVLVPHYVPSREMLESDGMAEGLKGQGIPENLIGSDSVLTGTVYADPGFFQYRDDAEPLDYTHFRATRRHEMLFPSDKVLLISWWGGGGTPDFAVDDSYDFPATFGDGSTTWFGHDELIAMPTALVPFGGAIPTHTTVGGLAGRDR